MIIYADTYDSLRVNRNYNADRDFSSFNNNRNYNIPIIPVIFLKICNYNNYSPRPHQVTFSTDNNVNQDCVNMPSPESIPSISTQAPNLN